MIVRFRHATDDERNGPVRSAWLDAVLPKGPRMFPAPRRGHEIGVRLARRALELVILELLASDETVVLVAELPDVPGELLGWVAFDATHTHFVRVVAGYGRRGLGRELLHRAGGLPPSYLTSAGRSLLVVASQGEAHA